MWGCAVARLMSVPGRTSPLYTIHNNEKTNYDARAAGCGWHSGGANNSCITST